MPKQATVKERSARTVRMAPALGQKLDRLAVLERKTFNDLVVELVEEALALREMASEEGVREILGLAGSIASRRISAVKAKFPDLAGNARLVMIEAVLKGAISEATEKLLVPHENNELTIALWSIAKEVAGELGLEGPAWDYVNSLGSKTPPPSQAQVELLSDAITELKESKIDQHIWKKVEALNVYLGLARDEHEESWREMKAEARKERDEALQAILRSKASEER
jgi:hypothetical protein